MSDYLILIAPAALLQISPYSRSVSAAASSFTEQALLATDDGRRGWDVAWLKVRSLER